MQDDFKPCDSLTPADLERHSIWSFDTDHEESGEGDETWVRPIELSAVPDQMAAVYVKARIRTPDGTDSVGAILVAFRNYKPEIDGVAMLSPRYFYLAARNGKVVPIFGMELPGEILAKLPIRYSAVLTVGTRHFVFDGAISL